MLLQTSCMRYMWLQSTVYDAREMVDCPNPGVMRLSQHIHTQYFCEKKPWNLLSYGGKDINKWLMSFFTSQSRAQCSHLAALHWDGGYGSSTHTRYNLSWQLRRPVSKCSAKRILTTHLLAYLPPYLPYYLLVLLPIILLYCLPPLRTICLLVSLPSSLSALPSILSRKLKPYIKPSFLPTCLTPFLFYSLRSCLNNCAYYLSQKQCFLTKSRPYDMPFSLNSVSLNTVY